MKWKITSKTTGNDHGTFDADSANEAMERLAEQIAREDGASIEAVRKLLREGSYDVTQVHEPAPAADPAELLDAIFAQPLDAPAVTAPAKAVPRDALAEVAISIHINAALALLRDVAVYAREEWVSILKVAYGDDDAEEASRRLGELFRARSIRTLMASSSRMPDMSKNLYVHVDDLRARFAKGAAS